MTYQLLTKDELEDLYYNLRDFFEYGTEFVDYAAIEKALFATASFYDGVPVKFTVSVDGNYDDEGYDNNVFYVAAFDKSGKELAVLSGRGRDLHEKWGEISLPRTNEFMSDFTVPGHNPLSTRLEVYRLVPEEKKKSKK